MDETLKESDLRKVLEEMNRQTAPFSLDEIREAAMEVQQMSGDEFVNACNGSTSLQTFAPESEELPPITDLESLSQVSEDDVTTAAQKWRDNPPNEEYTNILDAEEAEDG